MAYTSLLEDRAIVALAGVETRDFLQGLITNDMAACTKGRAIYAALLTPQGKILFDFFVVSGAENQFLIDCARARAADLLKRLMLYRLRAKVEISLRTDLAVAALWGEGAAVEFSSNIISFLDPRLNALGLRVIGPDEALRGMIAAGAAENYARHRINLGVPDTADLHSDQVFALDAGMEELNGVNFKKGCYVGQEVTSRMKHRSSARRRFVIAEFEGNPPPLGTAILSDGRQLGEMATASGSAGLALVRLDRLVETEESHAAISANGQPVHLRKPGWLAA